MKTKLTKDIVNSKLEEVDFSQPLSLKKIRDKTRVNGELISKSYMIKFLHKSDNYRNVDPLEVGSGKHKINVWSRV